MHRLTTTRPSHPIVRRALGTLLALIALGPITAAQFDAEFSAGTVTGFRPLVVDFTDTTSGEAPQVWNWSFGDGFFSPLQHPSHTYDEPGTYTVELTVFTAQGFGGPSDTETKVAFIEVLEVPTCTERLKLLASDGVDSDWFGVAVGADGGRAIVGVQRYEGDDNEYGSAYLYDTTTGAELDILVTSEVRPGDLFARQVALEGNLAAIAAELHDDRGALYLFNTATGNEIEKIQPPDIEEFDFFGASLDLVDGVAAIGSTGDDDQATAAGAVYLYDVSPPSAPTLLHKLTASDGGISETFGERVSLSDGRLAVAATGDLQGGVRGSVYLFDVATGTELGKFFPTAPSGGGNLASIALDGDLLLAGSLLDTSIGDLDGTAWLYDVSDPSAPVLVHTWDPVDGLDWHYFGAGVALAEPLAFVGATNANIDGDFIGATYVYDTQTGDLVTRLAADDILGGSVGYAIALDGDIAVLGSWGDDTLGFAAGSAFVFDIAPNPWSDLGEALAGAGGEPVLTGLGQTFGGCPVQLALSGAAAETMTFLVIGLGQSSAPLKGGVLVPTPDLILGLATNPDGGVVLTTPLPDGLPPGLSLYFQHWIVDATGPSGFAASNGLRATTP